MERRNQPAGHTGRQQSALQKTTTTAIPQQNRTARKPIGETEGKARKYLATPDGVRKVTTVQMKKLLAGYKQVGKQ